MRGSQGNQVEVAPFGPYLAPPRRRGVQCWYVRKKDAYRELYLGVNPRFGLKDKA